MMAATSQMLALLAANVRIPAIECIVMLPNPNNVLVMGSQIMLDGILDITISNNEEQSSDRVDLTLANNDGRYSPLVGSDPYGNNVDFTQTFDDITFDDGQMQ